MNKIEIHTQTSEEQKKMTDELIFSLSKDPIVIDFFQRKGIASEMIQKYPWRIKSWYDQFIPCVGCKGLTYCKQKQKGHYPNLVDDGLLHTEIAECKYQQTENKTFAHISNYIINDLPEKMKNVSFDAIDITDQSNEYVDTLKTAINAADQSGSLYLWGRMGTGKTYLAACAANDQAKAGKRVAFVNYPLCIQRMTSLVRTGEYKTEFRKLCYADFLVLDDIGAESVTEWNRDQILFPLLSERYEKHLPTWFTSNEDYESLEDHFRFSGKGKEEDIKAMRILERIQAMCIMKALNSEDRRIS